MSGFGSPRISTQAVIYNTYRELRELITSTGSDHLTQIHHHGDTDGYEVRESKSKG